MYGSSARTLKPCSRGPASSVPPNAATRSRMPTRPWPPCVRARRPPPSSVDDAARARLAVVDGDRRGRAVGVADRRSSPPPGRSGTRTRRARRASARGAPSTASVIGTPAARAPSSTPPRSSRPGCGASAASSRSTFSVRCSSPIVWRPSVAIASARSSPVTAASASACTTISATSWPTASCSSRAIRSRSSVAAASASNSRSRAAAAWRSTHVARRADRRPRRAQRRGDRLEPVVHRHAAARATIAAAARRPPTAARGRRASQ